MFTKSNRFAAAAALLLALAASCVAQAAVKFGAPFVDGAVLQREKPVPVWGTAAGSERVVVSFADQRLETVADATGAWRVTLKPLAASFAVRELKANEAVVRDVLVGEVWFCSGQSNMQFPLCGKMARFFDRHGALTAQLTHKPNIRFFNAMSRPAWKCFTPENLSANEAFSAVGVYFALELASALEIPVGVMGAWYGGTRIETWIPPEGFAAVPELKEMPAVVPDHQKTEIQQPSVLWNRVVRRTAPYAVRGLLWYHGESNSMDYFRYPTLLKALWTGWSACFENPELPFHVVQIAPYGPCAHLPEIQAAQARYVKTNPFATLTVVNDLGNEFQEYHPNEKMIVAKRLAAHALRRNYGFASVQDQSPEVADWKVDGRAVVVSFVHAKALYYYNPDPKEPCAGFELAGADGVWRSAQIDKACFDAPSVPHVGGLKGTMLRFVSEGVDRPVAIRYLYRKPWRGALFNEVNLPLGSFKLGELK